MKYLNYSNCDSCEDFYDSDREIDTDFFSKAELEEFAAARHYKILEDLPDNKFIEVVNVDDLPFEEEIAKAKKEDLI